MVSEAATTITPQLIGLELFPSIFMGIYLVFHAAKIYKKLFFDDFKGILSKIVDGVRQQVPVPKNIDDGLIEEVRNFDDEIGNKSLLLTQKDLIEFTTLQFGVSTAISQLKGEAAASTAYFIVTLVVLSLGYFLFTIHQPKIFIPFKNPFICFSYVVVIAIVAIVPRIFELLYAYPIAAYSSVIGLLSIATVLGFHIYAYWQKSKLE